MEFDEMDIETGELPEDVVDDVQEDEFEDLEEVLQDDEVEDVEPEVEPEEEEAEEVDVDDDVENVANNRLFDEKQQAEVNRIIKARLERQEEKLVSAIVEDLTNVAGTEIAYEELSGAAKLWGLLKTNPQLSYEVEGLIQAAIHGGKAKAPELESQSLSAKEQQLAFKEAVLDLKMTDSTFQKNADKILAWSQKEGFEVKDSKTLNLAYLAWKGSQGAVAQAVQKAAAKRKQETKKAMQQKANVQSTKNGASQSKAPSYVKMSDAAVLANEGLSLFTDD